MSKLPYVSQAIKKPFSLREKQMAIVIFRQFNDALDQVRENLNTELRAGRLRQGWGYVGNGASMTLRDAQGAQVPRLAWEANYQQARPDWGHPERRYTILIRMLELVRGDVVIVPKMPADTAFSVACVSEFEPGESYIFDPPNWIIPWCPEGHSDFGHIIAVNPASVMTYPNEQNEHTGAIADIIKGAPYMSAVNIVQNPDIAAELNAALAGLGFECPA